MKKQLFANAVQSIRIVLKTEKGKDWARFWTVLLLFPTSLLFLSQLMPKDLRPAIVKTQLALFLLGAIAIFVWKICPPIHLPLKKLQTRLREFYKELSTAQRLYLNVVCLGLGFLFLIEIGAHQFAPMFSWTFVAFCIFVALFDALRWYGHIASFTLGKAVIGIGFTIASTLAYAIARQEIASVIHVTPINFAHTTLLMAIMTIPVLVVLAGGLIFLVCMIASLVLVPFLLLLRDAPASLKGWLFAGIIKGNPMKFPLFTKAFQLFFYATFGLLVLRLGGIALVRYEAELQKRIPAAIYHFDMYPGKECKLQPGEKLAPLGDSKFLLGKTAPGGNFEFPGPVKCDDLPLR